MTLTRQILPVLLLILLVVGCKGVEPISVPDAQSQLEQKLPPTTVRIEDVSFNEERSECTVKFWATLEDAEKSYRAKFGHFKERGWLLDALETEDGKRWVTVDQFVTGLMKDRKKKAEGDQAGQEKYRPPVDALVGVVDGDHF